jgi:hypothetical protein
MIPADPDTQPGDFDKDFLADDDEENYEKHANF